MNSVKINVLENLSRARHAPPKASAMIEALRGLGYSTETALADIIDNSIAAKAQNIDLLFLYDQNRSAISILDDGVGMSAESLDKALRLGERNPLEKRSSHDLGRFGLGLKTASFSQCRRLTVASIADDGLQCLRWDLDVLALSEGDGWFLLEGVARGSERYLEKLISADRGTLVLWEVLDRIITNGSTEQDFLNLIDRVEQHLSMVFHRYLEGVNGLKINISINGKKLLPWDPFLSGHPAKPWQSPVATAPYSKDIEIECHVLPHKDQLTDKEYQLAQGPEGWTSQQGFYVYRNQRLLVAGSWLDLGRGRSWTKDEAHQLARIRLDIPNTADAEWKIDIRKSIARPPLKLRSWLIRMAETTRAKARKTFANRGCSPKTTRGFTVDQAWCTEHFSGGMRYRIDKEHPVIRAVLDSVDKELLPQVKAMLRVIEETVPVQKIWLDTAENKETPRTNFDAAPVDEVISVLEIAYKTLVMNQGISTEMAKERLLRTEPFQKYPELIRLLPDNF